MDFWCVVLPNYIAALGGLAATVFGHCVAPDMNAPAEGHLHGAR